MTNKILKNLTPQLRFIDILMISPWKIALGKENMYPFAPAKKILVANPCSFIAQKILIRRERNYKDRANDLLYLHDTIDVFSEHLAEPHGLYAKEIRPRLHARRVLELTQAGGAFWKGDRYNSRRTVGPGRKLSAKALPETGHARLTRFSSKNASCDCARTVHKWIVINRFE